MSVALVFIATALIGAALCYAVMQIVSGRFALWFGGVLSIGISAVAVRQYVRAQAAQDGWTGIAEFLGAALLLVGLLGWWATYALTSIWRNT